VDTLTRSLYVDEAAEVSRYTVAYEHLLAEAATPTASTKLIAAAAKELTT
jgi:hypothetical protein